MTKGSSALRSTTSTVDLNSKSNTTAPTKAVNPLAVTTLVGAALIGTPVDNVPTLSKASRAPHSQPPEVEVADGTLRGRAPAAAKRGPNKAAEDQVRRRVASSGSKGYWAKMTPAQRSKEMKRRQKVAQQRAKLSPKSRQAVESTLEELRRQKRREKDATRHRIQRAKEKHAEQREAKQQLPKETVAA